MRGAGHWSRLQGDVHISTVPLPGKPRHVRSPKQRKPAKTEKTQSIAFQSDALEQKSQSIALKSDALVFFQSIALKSDALGLLCFWQPDRVRGGTVVFRVRRCFVANPCALTAGCRRSLPVSTGAVAHSPSQKGPYQKSVSSCMTCRTGSARGHCVPHFHGLSCIRACWAVHRFA